MQFKKYAQVKNNIVINISIDEQLDGYIECPPYVEPGWSYENNEFMPPIPPKPDPKITKLQEIASIRYAEQTSGFNYNNIFIHTDPESINMINGATLSAIDDPEYTCNWKTPQGFVTLNATQIKEISKAIRNFIQERFDKEALLIEKINAAKTEEELEKIDWFDKNGTSK